MIIGAKERTVLHGTLFNGHLYPPRIFLGRDMAGERICDMPCFEASLVPYIDSCIDLKVFMDGEAIFPCVHESGVFTATAASPYSWNSSHNWTIGDTPVSSIIQVLDKTCRQKDVNIEITAEPSAGLTLYGRFTYSPSGKLKFHPSIEGDNEEFAKNAAVLQYLGEDIECIALGLDKGCHKFKGQLKIVSRTKPGGRKKVTMKDLGLLVDPIHHEERMMGYFLNLASITGAGKCALRITRV